MDECQRHRTGRAGLELIRLKLGSGSDQQMVQQPGGQCLSVSQEHAGVFPFLPLRIATCLTHKQARHSCMESAVTPPK